MFDIFVIFRKRGEHEEFRDHDDEEHDEHDDDDHDRRRLVIKDPGLFKK